MAAERLLVEMAPVEAKTAKVAAEPVPIEKVPDRADDAEIDGSEIEQ